MFTRNAGPVGPQQRRTVAPDEEEKFGTFNQLAATALYDAKAIFYPEAAAPMIDRNMAVENFKEEEEEEEEEEEMVQPQNLSANQPDVEEERMTEGIREEHDEELEPPSRFSARRDESASMLANEHMPSEELRPRSREQSHDQTRRDHIMLDMSLKEEKELKRKSEWNPESKRVQHKSLNNFRPPKDKF